MVVEKTARTSDQSINNSTEKSSTRIIFKDSDVLRLPSIYNYMPHLMDSPGSLKPSLHISKDREGGKLYIRGMIDKIIKSR